MSGARPDTWMPFYIGDYLVDTMHLNTEQHGAYCLLLFACWKRAGVLPSDEMQLASIAKMSPQKWRDNRAILLAYFIKDGDCLSQKRVTEELDRAIELTEKRSAAGKRGGRPKANEKQNDKQTESKSPYKDETKPKQNETPSQSHSSSLRSELSESKDSDGKPPSDPLKALFDFGVSVLTSSGVKDHQARSLLGKWRSELDDDAKLMSLLVTAKNTAAIEPKAYISAAITKEKNRQTYGGGYVPQHPGAGG